MKCCKNCFWRICFIVCAARESSPKAFIRLNHVCDKWSEQRHETFNYRKAKRSKEGE